MHAILTCTAPDCENDLDSPAAVGTGYCDSHLRDALEHGDGWECKCALCDTVREAWFAYRAQRKIERMAEAEAHLTPGQRASRDRMNAIPTTTHHMNGTETTR